MDLSLPLTPPYEQDANEAVDIFEGGNDEEADHFHITENFMFNCQGDAGVTGFICDDAFMKGGVLVNMMLHNRPYSSMPSNLSTMYSPESVYFNLKDCFKKVLLKTHMIEENLETLRAERTTPCQDLRKEIVSFYAYLSQFINENSRECGREFYEEVAREIMNTLEHILPFESWPRHVTSASSLQGNECSSPAYHLLHLHLDVRWWSLVILIQLEKLSPNIKPSNDTPLLFIERLPPPQQNQRNGSYFDMCVDFIIWDIITLLERQISQFSIPEFSRISAFPCTCSTELAVSLVHLLDFKNRGGFWDKMNSKLLTLLKVSSEGAVTPAESSSYSIYVPPKDSCKLTMAQVWWMFAKLSRLYLYNTNGDPVSDVRTPMKPEPKLLRTFVVLALKSQPEELELRFYLTSCLCLMKLWSRSQHKASEWVTLIWDFFSRKLDSNFLMKSSGLDGIACLNKSPHGWIEQTRRLTTDSDDDLRSENSWFIFLRILVHVFQNGDEWRGMRGRIYSKFHEKKMRELSALGLHNTISLFLTLAIGGETEAMCSKLIDMLSYVPCSKVGKKKVVLLGFLCIAYLMVGKSMDLKEISVELNERVSSTVQEMTSTPDTSHKRDLGGLIIIYCEGVQEILKCSTEFTLSQSYLLCPTLSRLITNGSQSESKAVLSMLKFALETILEETKKLHSLAVGNGGDLIEAIWLTFGPSLKSALCTRSLSGYGLGSLCSSLVLCSHRMQRYSEVLYRDIASKATSLFADLVENVAVSNLVRCKFIGCILGEEDSFYCLSTIYPKYETKLFSSFLGCLLQLGSCEEVLVASDRIFKMPELNKMVPFTLPCPFGATKLLVTTMAERLNKEDFRAGLLLREKVCGYFSSFDKALFAFMKRVPYPAHLQEVLDLVACLVETGHSILYVKGNVTCPLAGFLSAVILPTHIYSEKPLNSSFAEAFQPVLPKVLEGLSKLSPGRDPYISRCIKNIFSNYLFRFPVDSHPFYHFFTKSDSLEVQELFLNVVRDSYILNRKISQIHLQLALNLLKNLVSSQPEKWITLTCKLTFHPVLEVFLRVEDIQTNRCLSSLLESALPEKLLSQHPEARASVIASISAFIKSQLSWHSKKIFIILEGICCCNCFLVLDSMNVIAEEIKVIEGKRGTSYDINLRSGYESLLKSLDLSNENSSNCNKIKVNTGIP